MAMRALIRPLAGWALASAAAVLLASPDRPLLGLAVAGVGGAWFGLVAARARDRRRRPR